MRLNRIQTMPATLASTAPVAGHAPAPATEGNSPMSQPGGRRRHAREAVLIDLTVLLVLVAIVTTSALLGGHLIHNAIHR